VWHGSWSFPFSHFRSTLWATVETLKIGARPGLIVVVNLVPPRSRLTERIGVILPAPVPRSRRPGSGNRVASAQAVALGLGVTKTPYDPRSAEISALAEEIRDALLGFKPRLQPQESSADPMGYRFLPARNRKFESISLQQRVQSEPRKLRRQPPRSLGLREHRRRGLYDRALVHGISMVPEHRRSSAYSDAYGPIA
jgi:hypothetical protein